MRSTTLCIIIAAVVFFIGYKADKKSKVFIKGIILCIALAALVSGLYSDLVSSLSVSTTEKSYVARMGAYSYYFGMIRDNIVSGLAFIDFDKSPYFSLVHGGLGLYYPSDVGIVGTTVSYGVLTGIWYLLAIIESVKKWLRDKECTLLLILMIVLLYTSLTLSMLDNGRFTMFAVIMFLEEKAPEYMETVTKKRIKFKI